MFLRLSSFFGNCQQKSLPLENRCPHKGGPLSEGIVSGERVICPMHGLKMSLIDGSALPPDEGNVKTYEIKTEDERVWIRL